MPNDLYTLLTPKQVSIVEILARRGGNVPVPGPRIVDHVYVDDPNGGPDDALSVLRSQISKLNSRWEREFGYRLVRSIGHHGYVLTRDVSSALRDVSSALRGQ